MDETASISLTFTDSDDSDTTKTYSGVVVSCTDAQVRAFKDKIANLTNDTITNMSKTIKRPIALYG